MRTIHIRLIIVLALMVAEMPARAQGTAPASETSSREQAMLAAFPVEAAITIDGALDEAAWGQAPIATGFRQFEPVEGAPASQRTEVRVLYGDNSLYVGALLYDDPAAIEQALGRRDDFNRADWFLVSIDSYFDRRMAYTFGVNAAGVQFDAIQTGGDGGPGGGGDGGGGNAPNGMDPSWDAVWYSDVRVTPQGWAVEMRIPYSMLRFAEADSQTWGIHFSRHIPRLGEQAEWPLVPRAQRANLVAQFGLLTGITGIQPRRNVQVRPYSVARLHTNEQVDDPGELARDGSVDVGGDLKIGLGPNITLDATINPDFGQVESDPAVLNLTAFETFFDERRPFFVEGSQIYQFSVGPGQLLYTRRIGADAPIIGAAKLSGRTAGGLSFGLLGATTGDNFDPGEHYGVARVSQQFGRYSSAGGILTAFDGSAFGEDGRQRSLAGGADWDIRLLDNRYGIEGFTSFTHRRFAARGLGPETGFAGKTWIRRRQGAWKGFVGLDVFGNRFNPNDLGQLQENNFIALLTSVDHDVNGGRPFGPFLRASADAFGIQQFSFDEGLNLGYSLDLGSRWMLRGFQEIEFGAEIQNPWGGYDLFETRGLGPWAQPFGVQFRGEVGTDERRSWQIEPELSLALNADGGYGYEAGLRGEWNVSDRLSLSGDLEGEWEDDIVAWSSNESFLRVDQGWLIGVESRPPSTLEPEDYVPFDDLGRLGVILAGVEPIGENSYFVPVFGARDTRALDLTLRSTVTFTPDLSLQLYGQLFLARGRYDHFRILQNPDNLARFEPFPKRDEFAFSSLQSNAVLRWEYRPGSALFLVWTHGRRADDALNPLAPLDASSPYDRPIDGQIVDTFDIFPDNVFLVKLNYTFLY